MSNKKIYRAGIIPYHIQEDNIQMMFMLPSDTTYGGNCFQIAKGKQEEGENNEETAFREAKEELGLFKGNCTNIHKLGNFLGRTMIYVVEVADPNFFGDPHFETQETKWMSPEEFYSSGRDLHKPIVQAAVRHIGDILK